MTFDELLIVFLAIVNLLHLFYVFSPPRCCLLHLMRQNYLLSDFQYGFRSSWSTAEHLTDFWQGLVFSSSSQTKVLEFLVKHLTLFHLSSVIDSLEWLWMVSLHKNIELMLEFLYAPFLVLNISNYRLIFLMMLSVILRTMLLIL